MPGDGFTIRSRIKNLLRSQSIRSKKKSRGDLPGKVTLEKVLGITASGNSALTCDPKSGLIAYPAGCVVVLLDPRNNRQNHIINTSRKTITALAFSPDGRYLVTGESGHLPAVRLWDVAERRHVAELQKHKYGVSCVAFSPNNKYIVSVGNQHDMMVNVWAWKMDVVVAANKVSSKVTGVSFSEDRSYFVTVGNRHVKFWYLDHCKASKTSAAVPLLGRVGLLGELRNNFFCDVACGRGSSCDSTFCITSSGLLCELNKSRTLDKWVDLQTSMAQSISLSEDSLFCGCADGIVRVFSPDLRFVGTLPRPHALGADVSSRACATKADYPDVIGVAYDSAHRWLSCVYNDHSLYVWDVRDVQRAGKLNSALFHAACVWDLQMFPDVSGEPPSGLSDLSGSSSGGFLTCSADGTVRLWCTEERTQTHKNSQNFLSKDLLRIIYTNRSTGAVLDPECSADKSEPRSGIRTISVSPDGKHLASGDRGGMLRIHDLSSLEEVMKVEAHDAEILCLEYSKPETGLQLLASASRDRLIHILDASSGYSLVQTLDQHSSSITAVRFAVNENKVSMISCGADKSIYFHTAQQTDRGTEFRRSHHMVRKTTLYDMSVDATSKYAAVGCQDRCVRIFNISSGKQKKVYKGSVSEDGILLKVQVDPSGQYVATSCSDKNISIFDFYSGECVATAFGHSEIVTGMKFTNDCKYLITVSGDSCIFMWRLAPELTFTMKERLHQLQRNPNSPPFRSSALRREVHSAPVLGSLTSNHHLQEDGEEVEDGSDHDDGSGSSSSDNSHEDEESGSWDEGQNLETVRSSHPVAPPHGGAGGQVTPDAAKRPRRRWSHRIGSLELMVKSMLDLRQLETFGPKKTTNWLDRDKPITSSLQDSMEQVEERSRRRWRWLSPPRDVAAALFPEESELSDGEYAVRECRDSSSERGLLSQSQDGCSPDSACSLGYDSRESIPDCSPDWEPLGKPEPSRYLESRNRSSSEEEEEDEKEEMAEAVTSLDEALRRVNADHGQQDFLKENYETLGESCSIEQNCAQRVSISSRFLSRGRHDRRVPLFTKMAGKDLDAKLPLLRVQTTMEDGSVSGCRAEGEPDVPVKLRTSRKSSGSHLWRRSSPAWKDSLSVDSPLQKSHSAQNLASNSLGSPAPPGVQRESRVRPQLLWLSADNLKPPFLVSSPSSGSPGSPGSPQPWESPKSRSPHSYMNPTISSLAKSSRSLSLGDDLQSVSPPHSPCSCGSRRRSSGGDVEMEPPLFSSSPVTASVSSMPSLLLSPPRSRPAASPVRLNAPPSRIPLLSAGHLHKMKPSSSWCGAAVGGASSPADAGYHVPPSPEKLKACSRQLSLGLDPVSPSSLPVRQKRSSLPERRAGDEKQRPLVAGDVFSTNPQPDSAVSMETCRRTATDLQSSLQKTVELFAMLPRRNQRLSEEQQEMRDVLTEALLSVRAQLDSLPLLNSPHEGAEG
ncbi:mitogen-activated protein kinase-binding protein 1 isoform X1 [Oryzias melastigma]|uniref:mitogen-activated protein kinase-binding protein 1 isoform X1 n=1 Tax=Oryzias melastigma TaxID=30732 RepID=UPI000CF81F4D|nr:mitogen-activated protein kinase-binding protein 1 isoform X1 [Oryzias melastigma]